MTTGNMYKNTPVKEKKTNNTYTQTCGQEKVVAACPDKNTGAHINK